MKEIPDETDFSDQNFPSCKFFRDGILAYTNTQNYINPTWGTTNAYY
jgi:hypothetical protein